MSTTKKRKTAMRDRAGNDPAAEKQERDKAICYRFAQIQNATRVAKEFGVNRMYVTRLWNRQSAEEKEAIMSVREQVDEDLNRRILKAENIAGDSFAANIVAARENLGKELIRRCDETIVRGISDRDFTSLLRLVASIANPSENPTDPAKGKDDFFGSLRESIDQSIHQNEK